MKEKSDKELIESYLAGNDKSFEELVSRHIDSVYKFAYRYTRNADEAGDVTQETFVKAWKNIKSFDTGKKFITWLLTITKNTSLDFLKKKKPVAFSRLEIEREIDMADMVMDESPLPDELAEMSREKEALSRLLQKLPADYRTVIFMRYNDNLKFREIAEALGESINTVKSRHARGLKVLKKMFDGTLIAPNGLS